TWSRHEMTRREMERRTDRIMRVTLLVFLVACPDALAQTRGDDAASTPQVFVYQSVQGADATAGIRAVRKDSAPGQGAPYSAMMTTESVQPLADGNRIVAKTTGLVARDSLGRTRQQMESPSIGNLSAANLPQIVFIQDPVAQTAYTLNLTDKTVHTMPVASLM